MFFAPFKVLGRLLLAVALLLSTTPHSHSANGIDHAASVQARVTSVHSHDLDADTEHDHDRGGGDSHHSDHSHGQKVADHSHEKPCPVSVVLMPRSPLGKCWVASVQQHAWNTRYSRLDRPPRDGFDF